MNTATQTTQSSKNKLPESMFPVESTAKRAKKMRDVDKELSPYEIVVNIALNTLYRDMVVLDGDSIESPFESGDLQDSDAGWAIDIAVKQVFDMMHRSVIPKMFDIWLCGLYGVVSCAYRSLTNKDTAYAYTLESVMCKIRVFGGMAELAVMDGQKFLQREV